MPLGTEVNLGSGDVVLDGVAAPPKMGTVSPVFFPCLLWPNGWMDEDATWYGSITRPRPHCVRRGPSSSAKGAQQPRPLFGVCLLWPRSPISATVELLLYALHVRQHVVRRAMLHVSATSVKQNDRLTYSLASFIDLVAENL